ncbi:alkaline phosphatase [Pseudoduganella namucuonensis]|uniref:Alkaline phosphatase n=1 Tax=Pseudoduganella namucuonensis TaxID=1035707 RepID=A0A1I7LIJ0_9BURK|nr:alkaline phosphatase [Pseudoduganella namucuonensis]SFV09500.1 alkaline phosphatase [Pseudoduganella namucuonensis]
MKKIASITGLLLASASLHAAAAGEAKNVIFFLGDGMGPTIITAARIHQYKEEGLLKFERLDRVARVKTYSQDAQTTDSAPSMGSYMTGVKIQNEVISMSSDTKASAPKKDAHGNNTVDTCAPANGKPAVTILELAKARGKAVGAVTTTEATHATPASTYAHSCHRDSGYAIAAQAVPGGAGYNAALGDGLDVLMGGGRHHFTPYDAQANPRGRADGRDLLAELAARGYLVATDKARMAEARPGRKFVGLYARQGHLAYENERAAAKAGSEAAGQPSLSEMTSKAIDLLSAKREGFFLMVEGGKIDHALHDSQAKNAVVDLVAFDDAIQTAIDRMQKLDPGLRETLIVVTADHDHTLAFNGNARRGNPILDIVRDAAGAPARDADGRSYTALNFGNGPNRPNERAELSSEKVLADGYHQETGVRLNGETHGGGDVKLYAVGAGARDFKGTMENTRVFDLMKAAFGF